MTDIMFCLLIAAARHTLTSTHMKEVAFTMIDFLYHPTMSDNPNMLYMAYSSTFPQPV